MSDLEQLLEHVGRTDRRKPSSDGWVLWLTGLVLLALAAGFGAGLVFAGVLELSDAIRWT